MTTLFDKLTEDEWRSLRSALIEDFNLFADSLDAKISNKLEATKISNYYSTAFESVAYKQILRVFIEDYSLNYRIRIITYQVSCPNMTRKWEAFKTKYNCQ